MKPEKNILEEEFLFIKDKDSLEEFFNEYRTELSFTHGKLELEQVESAVNYQRAVVKKEDIKRFTIMITLGLLGAEELNLVNLERYLSLSNTKLTLSDFDKLNGENLDAE